jgi:hypothetical protein
MRAKLDRSVRSTSCARTCRPPAVDPSASRRRHRAARAGVAADPRVPPRSCPDPVPLLRRRPSAAGLDLAGGRHPLSQRRLLPGDSAGGAPIRAEVRSSPGCWLAWSANSRRQARGRRHRSDHRDRRTSRGLLRGRQPTSPPTRSGRPACAHRGARARCRRVGPRAASSSTAWSRRSPTPLAYTYDEPNSHLVDGRAGRRPEVARRLVHFNRLGRGPHRDGLRTPGRPGLHDPGFLRRQVEKQIVGTALRGLRERVAAVSDLLIRAHPSRHREGWRRQDHRRRRHRAGRRRPRLPDPGQLHRSRPTAWPTPSTSRWGTGRPRWSTEPRRPTDRHPGTARTALGSIRDQLMNVLDWGGVGGHRSRGVPGLPRHGRAVRPARRQRARPFR